MKYFIDTMLLDLKHLDKIDKTSKTVEYFYPYIDPYIPSQQMEEPLLKTQKNFQGKFGTTPTINLNKKDISAIINSKKYDGRFSKILNPLTKKFAGNNFLLENGEITWAKTLSNSKVGLTINPKYIDEYNKTVDRMRDMFPFLSLKNKDIHVLATVINCGKNSFLIKTFMSIKNGKDFWDIDINAKKINEQETKIFLTLDTKGIFNYVNQIEEEFSNIKIYKASTINQLVKTIKASEERKF
jgi:hypothetical protein